MAAQHDSWLKHPLRWLTQLATRRPRVTLGVALAIAAICLTLASIQLGMRTDRLDLISQESRFNQRWINYISEFGDRDDVVVVVEGEKPEDVLPAIDALTDRLKAQTTDCDSLLSSIDPSPLRAKALYYLDDEQLAAADKFVARNAPIARGEWNLLNLGKTFDELAGAIAYHTQSGDATATKQVAGQLERSAVATLAAFETTPRYMSPWPEPPEALHGKKAHRRYLLANDGRVGVILLRLKGQDQGLAKHSGAIDRIRKTIDAAQAKLPAVKIGLTGLPILENDEMRISEQATIRAGLLSLVGVSCLFIAGFGGLRYPLMTVGALLIGLAWTMGYVTIAIGHLNILSMSFGVILIGLGIDFGIHYVARYAQLRRELPAQQALESTAASVGPGVLVGAITTAAAFFTAGFTDFTGVAELGVIAGGGIILCAIVAILVLPAMIRMTEGSDDSAPPSQPVTADRWAANLTRSPKLSLAISLAATLLLCVGLPSVWFDHNLLNLQAEDLESVRWEQKLIRESDQSVWYAVSTVGNREELLERKQAFQQLASVERVEEVASWLPATSVGKVEVISKISRQVAALPQTPDRIPVVPVGAFLNTLQRCEQMVATSRVQSNVASLLSELRSKVGQTSPAEYFQRISWLQQSTASDLLSRLQLLASGAAPSPPSTSDLPDGLVTRFVGRSGQHLIKVYGRGNIWDMDALARFVRDVRTVDSEATGKPLQTYEASRQMQRSYIDAAFYALIAVVLVLLVDFRDPRLVLMAIVPVVLGGVQMFGIMGLLGIPLNAANMIVLPLILGIGIDDGVHVVHDYRRQLGGTYRVSRSTASAVLMTSVTTIVGFGSLMIASHRGLESLGRVLTLGVTCCLVSSLVILPAILAWSSRQNDRTDSANEGKHDDLPSGDNHHRLPNLSDRLIEPRRRAVNPVRHAA